VPATLTTPSDWLLFQELQAQADCFITHGGYLRALAAGTLDNILRFGSGADNAHLLQWRQQNGLPRQPEIVIASASLDFPLPEQGLLDADQPVYIVTGEQADRARVRAWQDKGIAVLFAGGGRLVEGKPLFNKLADLGFHSVYLEAGPMILETMLRDGVLSRLYITMNHQLLGGGTFHTLLSGTELGKSGRLKLRSLYFEALSDQQNGQFFSCFETLSPE
jgi:riboflavin biosynthesis pyrimidine reductase